MWGGSVTYKYRVEDPRLGRFFSVDPLYAEYPWNSNYAFSENRLIDAIELEGLECVLVNDVPGLIASRKITLHVTNEYVVAQYRYEGYHVMAAIMAQGPTSSDIETWNPLYEPALRWRMKRIDWLCADANEKLCSTFQSNEKYEVGWDEDKILNTYRHLLGYTLSVFVNGLEDTQMMFDAHERSDDPKNPLNPHNNDFIADIINNDIATEFAISLESQFSKSGDVTVESVTLLMNEYLCRVMEQYAQSEMVDKNSDTYISSYSNFCTTDKIVIRITNFLKDKLPNE